MPTSSTESRMAGVAEPDFPLTATKVPKYHTRNRLLQVKPRPLPTRHPTRSATRRAGSQTADSIRMGRHELAGRLARTVPASCGKEGAAGAKRPDHAETGRIAGRGTDSLQDIR